MIRRAILVTTVGLLTVLGTSACNMLSPVATFKVYSPSEGTQGDLGPIKARNIMYLTDGNGHGAFFGAIANSSSNTADFALKIEGGTSGSVYRQYLLGGYQVLNFGAQNQPPLKVAVKGKPGDITTVLLYTDTGSVRLNVPILDGTLPQYTDLVNALSAN